jgi:hypothetical protein
MIKWVQQEEVVLEGLWEVQEEVMVQENLQDSKTIQNNSSETSKTTAEWAEIVGLECLMVDTI